MKLSEQIRLSWHSKLSILCHASKYLYNLANYYVHQEVFNLDSWVRYYDLWFMLKHSKAYQQLPSQTAHQVLKQVDKD